MIISFILFTIPTIFLTYLIAINIEKIFTLPIMILYYFYLASTCFLVLAGTTDPGIFERRYMYLDKIKKIFNKFLIKII